MRLALAWLVLAGLAGAAGAAPGLVGRYYNNMSFSGAPALVRTDATVNFDWSTGSPGTGVNADNISIRWTGTVKVATTGSYTFQTSSDDGVRLYVNGALLINNWADHAVTVDTSAAVSLTAGVEYPIVLEFYENFIYAVIQLRWKRPGDIGFSVVPASNGTEGLGTGLAALAEYRFEDGAYNGTSGEVTDTSGNGYGGTGAGLSGSVPGLDFASPAKGSTSGTCSYGVFDRSTKDYVALPSSLPNLPAMGSFTVTQWIRTTDRTQAGQRIVIQDEGGYSGGSNGWIFSLGDRGAGMLNFLTRQTTAATDEVITSSVIANNTWYFAAFGVDASSKRKFIVVMDASGNIVANVSTTYTQATIGSYSGTVSIGGETNSAIGEATSSFGFAGNIDEVRVYPGALSTAELTTVFGLANPCRGLVAAYRFEETSTYNGTAGELKDLAGYNGGPYNGRAQGSTLPSTAKTSPARSGTPGTCGYASMPGPNSGGGYFTVTGLPVNTASGAQNAIAFWIYWNGTDDTTPVSFDQYNLWLKGGNIGFNTGYTTDLYGTSSTGLANGWHHVVAVFQNGSVTGSQLYIDGVKKTLATLGTAPNSANAYATTTLRIGTWGGSPGTSVLVGRIDEAKLYNRGLSAAEVAALYAETHDCATLHHLEIRHGSGSGVTCSPATLTIAACQDAACASSYTGGISGTLTASGTPAVAWPTGASFSIAAGSGTTTEQVQVTSAGSVVLGLTGLSATPSSATTCNFGSPSCTFTAADAGFVFDVPHHVAETSNTVSVSAVRKSDNATVCVPAFASVSKSVNFACSYTNPTSGTLPVRVGGVALNGAGSTTAACDGGGHAVTLAFNASGVASTTVQYADVGQISLTASYTGSGGDAGLVLTGSDGFIAAPAAFAFSAITAAPIKAGAAFSATVTATNSAGNATPNFGLENSPESATLAFTRRTPTGAGAASGTFSGRLGAFSAGAATASNLAWTEVGTGDLSATLASGSYLGSGLTASGTTGTGGAVGRFIPHHFDVTTAAACGSFSYAGQPFTATVTARNLGGGTTVNYDGSGTLSPAYAKAVTLSEAGALGVGALSGNVIAASGFAAGVGAGTPSYAFTAKQTAPQTLALRATDTDAVSSAGYVEGTMALRSGRLRIANGFGAETRALQLTVSADYWSGNAWLLNSGDSCTSLPAAAVAQSNKRDRLGNATTAWSTTASAVALAAGQGTLSLSPPGSGNTGSVDLALNLGSTSADQSCLASHPASTGAGLAWLRSRNGSCAATWDRDPAARASFGIYAPETRKTVHVRDLF